MYFSFATFEVASASSLILSKLSQIHLTKSRAPRASSKANTGARCIDVVDDGALDAAAQVEHLDATVV